MKRAILFVVLFSAAAVVVASSNQKAGPPLKPGRWELHYKSSAGGGMSGLPTTACFGSMSDQQRQLENANITKRCSKWESRQVNGNWVIDAVCTSPRGLTINKHTVTSLAGDSFHEENTASQGSSTSDGKWVGPCEPGQKPDALK
jgi:hypothetical protein